MMQTQVRLGREKTMRRLVSVLVDRKHRVEAREVHEVGSRRRVGFVVETSADWTEVSSILSSFGKSTRGGFGIYRNEGGRFVV